MPKKRVYSLKICKQCNVSFLNHGNYKYFCSKECSEQYLIRECAHCGKSIKVCGAWRVKERNYCDASCQNLYEYKHGIKDKFKITKEALKKVKTLIGPLHPNYNPDITDKQRIASRRIWEYDNFAKEVKKRDNYTCQKCGTYKSGNNIKVEAHHIEGYLANPDLRFDLNNGITFCYGCHKQYHRVFGQMANREQFILFMANQYYFIDFGKKQNCKKLLIAKKE